MKRLIPLFLLFVMLTSCRAEMDDLFRLPKRSDGYTQLQAKIYEEIDAGASFSAPIAGKYRQSVQLRDLDGDGIDEALAFFSVTGEHTLKICVYRAVQDGSYEMASFIEGDGTGIERIGYADMNADGFTDLIVGWSQGAGMKMLTIISMPDLVMTKIASTDYSEFTVDDIDNDSRVELIVIRLDTVAQSGEAVIFGLRANDELFTASAPLSTGIESLAKLGIGTLYDGHKALLIDSNYKSGLITDIFILDGDNWRNITLDKTLNSSADTFRLGNPYYRDINIDGIAEFPRTRILPGTGEITYRVLDWYAYDSKGRSTFAMTTYNNNSDGWYLIVPTGWRDKVSVRRVDLPGERCIVFSLWNGEAIPPEDFMIIYTLTGENRSSHAEREGRFSLRIADEVIYAASLLPPNSSWEHGITEANLRESFKLIYTDWDNGL